MRKLYALLIVFATCLFAGCDENGDRGYYEDMDRIYFVKDSIICRLGEMQMGGGNLHGTGPSESIREALE